MKPSNTKTSSSAATSIMQKAYRSLVLPTRGKKKTIKQQHLSDETSVTSVTDFDPTQATMMMEDNAQEQPSKSPKKTTPSIKKCRQAGNLGSKNRTNRAVANGTTRNSSGGLINEGTQKERRVPVPIPPPDDAPIHARRLYRRQMREYHRQLELIRSQGIEDILVHDSKNVGKPTVTAKSHWQTSDQSKVGNKKDSPKLEKSEEEKELSVIPVLLCDKTTTSQKDAVLKAFDSLKATQEEVKESQLVVEKARKALEQAERTLIRQEAAEKDARKFLRALLWKHDRLHRGSRQSNEV